MLLSEFDFPFDPALVADHPVIPRDRARMLVLERVSGARTHHHVADLPFAPATRRPCGGEQY